MSRLSARLNQHLKLGKFALVGAVGFMVDAAVFTLCFALGETPLLFARVVAFFVAATVTWLGNRYFTFKEVTVIQKLQRDASPREQWLKFIASACASALPNFLVFKAVLSVLGTRGVSPYIALVAGVLAGMVSNYTLSSRWVFKP
ncbi:GtrA family protein [Vibrio marinisediminis]